MDFNTFYNKHNIIIIKIFIKMYEKYFFFFKNDQINYTYIMVFRDLCKQLN